MTEHYVTIFNSKFLPQGLALYNSMKVHIPNFKLWVICVDQKCYEILEKLNYIHLKAINLVDYETAELLNVKSKRTFSEYCWTLTPYSFKFVFNKDNSIERLTYLDADMFFFDSPDLIFKELENEDKSVLITSHNYSPYYEHSKRSGKFCVQYLTIYKENGEKVRADWEKKCLEWCYNRFEDGKFGDQKYLDKWPIDFKDQVHILSNREAMLAPWNVLQYPTTNIVLYHFHGFRILNNKKYYISNYLIPYPIYNDVYEPYISEIKNAINTLEVIGFNDFKQLKNSLTLTIKSFMSVPYFIFKLFKYSHIITR